VAARGLGEWAAATVLVGFPGDRAQAYAAACPGPVLGCDGGGGDPVGALADLLTLRAAGPLASHRLAVLGDPSPRSLDLAVAVATLGGSVAFVHPVGFAPDPEKLTVVRERAAATGAAVLDTDVLTDGLRDATAVVVEPWPENQVERFRSYSLQRHQLRVVRAGAGILHRAPERRGAEMSASLADEAQWWAPAQRQNGVHAGVACLSALFHAKAARAVIG
jgi:ornithine carbamoyltransferase